MSGNITFFSVPKGFRLRRLEETMPPEEAAAILSTRRQRRYTSARREGDRCRLVRHVAVCPCCGRNSPAYADFLSPTEDGREPGIPAKRIREWGAGISFFPEDDELRFNAPWNEESFICPRCAGAAREDEEDWEVSVRWERDRVTMTVYECTPRDITDCLVQATREKYRLRLPLKETVVFALGKGRTVLTVSDSADRPLKIRDVSEPNLHWSCSFTSRILTISAAARRKLAQAFAAAGGAPLPFVRAEMTPERFLALCRFRGYGRDFYDALPLDRAGNLDRSFRTAARRMRDIRSLPRIFRESGLPDKKSIRRLFFETRPQLFWYCREAAVLWPMLGDVNVFRAFLNKSTGQEVLAFLHFYPSAAVWFRDYAAERGGRGLASLLSKREGLEQLLFSAVRYAAGSEAYRRKVRRSWTVGQTPTVRLSFDLPGYYLTDRRDMEVNGYSFRWLRNRAAFAGAGAAMRNCLGEYRPGENRVAVAWRGDEPAAAVEVSPRGTILQAYGPDNIPLRSESRVSRALSAWAARCRFRMRESTLFDEMDDLPF